MLFTSPPDSFPPSKKIISLVPSITELLWTLGLEKETVGITKFCVHPPSWLHEKKRIGGTKNIHVDEIIALQPDLVIASREENVKEQVDKLALQVPVYLTDVITVEDALKMILEVGQLTGRVDRAGKLVEEIASSIGIKEVATLLRHQTKNRSVSGEVITPAATTTIPTALSEYFATVHSTGPTIPTIYLIWKDPYMTIGGDTFINNMMKVAGFENLYANRTRYPEISFEEIAKSAAKFVFLSSEPYPFKEKHVEQLSRLLPGKTIMLVDGEMFSWYGSRMVYASNYFQELRTLVK